MERIHVSVGLAALVSTPVSMCWGLWGHPPPNPSQSCFSEVLSTSSPWSTPRDPNLFLGSPPWRPRFLGPSLCTFCQISSNCSTPSDTFLRQRSISPGQEGRKAMSTCRGSRHQRQVPRACGHRLYLGVCACPPSSLPYRRTLFILSWRRTLLGEIKRMHIYSLAGAIPET